MHGAQGGFPSVWQAGMGSHLACVFPWKYAAGASMVRCEGSLKLGVLPITVAFF